MLARRAKATGMLAVLAVLVVLAPGIRVHAARSGAIVGRAVNRTTGTPQAGVEITLFSALPDGSGRLRRTTMTDRDGRYRFDGLRTGAERLYVLDARYDGGLFSSPALQLPAGTAQRPVIRTTVSVWETIANPEAVLIQTDNLFLNPGEGGLGVIESINVVNTTDRAYIGRGEAGSPSLGLALPDGADGVQVIDSRLEIPGLVRTDFGAGLTVAIPPGETKITYAYRVPGTAGIHDLSRSALYPVLNAAVYAPGSIDVRSNRLEEDREQTVGTTDYTVFATDGVIEAGDDLQVVAEARSPSSSVLAWGLAAAAVLALVLVAIGVVMRRRRRARPLDIATAAPFAPQTRTDIVTAVARLDLDYRAGKIGEDEWRKSRAALMDRLHPEPEHSS